MTENWKPRAYQVEAIRHLLRHPAAGLFADPGLGKTSCTLAAILTIKAKVPEWKTLVIAPRHVVYNVWPGEIAKWSQFAGLKYAIVHGPQKERALASDADIYLINPEGLPWLMKQKRRRWDLLVVDESTKFKHPNTQRFRILREILNTFERRIILTGKPVPNGIMDLFGQIYILDGGARLGKFITHFRNKWFFQTGFGGYTWAPRQGAEQEILEKVSDITMRLDKMDHLDMPTYLDNRVNVQLPHEALEQYQRLERDFILRLIDGTVTALNAGAQTAKLRQMASGAVYTDTGEKAWSSVHNAKIEALDALLAEREGSPTLIAYQWEHSAERLATEFKGLEVLGWHTPSKARDLLDAWNRGEVELLAVHPASAAHGLNLQGGSEALVWFDPTYDLEHYDQLIARLWRQGQKKQVVNHLLVASSTVDVAILAALRGKDRTQSRFLAALKSNYGVK